MNRPVLTPAAEFATKDKPVAQIQHELPPLDLPTLLHLLRMRWLIILGVVAVFLVVSILVLLQITPLYSATAVVVLDSRKNSVQDLSNVLAGLPVNEITVRNQVAILTSRDLSQQVIEQLGLYDDPEFNEPHGILGRIPVIGPFLHPIRDPAKLSPDERKEVDHVAVVDNFLDRISASTIPLSSAISVTFQSKDAEKAARICNAIAKAYVDNQLAIRLEASDKATQWLTDRINELAKQLQNSDAAVQKFRADNNITETNDGNSVIEQQVTSINSQLVTARADLAEKQATYNRVTELANSGKATDVSQVVASPLIAQLRNQETDILKQQAEYSLRYGPNHPKVRDLESERADLQQKIDQEVQRVVQTVGNDLTIAQAKVNSLAASLRQAESHSSDESKAEVQLKSLESSTASLSELHNTLLSRLKETQNHQEIETPDARTISTASVADLPSYPKRNLILIAMTFAGLAFGVVLAVLLDRNVRGFRTGAEIEAMLSLPVLSTIPELTGGRHLGRRLSREVIDLPLSAYSEAFRGLTQNLDFTPVSGGGKILVVTSTVPEEGKTTLAVGFARLIAQSGLRVLLVDADLRNPTVVENTELKDSAHGLVAAILGTQPLQACLKKDPLSEMTVLAATKTRFKPAEVLNSAKIDRLFMELRHDFDVIVVDTSPLLPVNDARLFMRLADMLMLVVRWEKTPRDAVIRVVESMGNRAPGTVGVVLTRADMSRFHGYSYGYTGGYANAAFRKYHAEG